MSLLFILIMVAFISAAAGRYFLLMPDQIRRRLDALATSKTAPAGRTEPSAFAGMLARLPAPSETAENAALRVKCLHAGFRHDEERLFQPGPRSLLALLFAGLTFLVLANGAADYGRMLLAYVAGAAIFGAALPKLLLDWKIKQRRQQIFEAFPDAADLLLICVEAGLGLDAALDKVSREARVASAALAEELHLCRLELRAGATLEQSLKNFALRAGVDEVANFATMLTQADALGVSIGDSLRMFADDLRQLRLTRAEELAAKVPTKMLFPLVFCIFPSTLLVLVGPAVLQIARTFKPMVTGG